MAQQHDNIRICLAFQNDLSPRPSILRGQLHNRVFNVAPALSRSRGDGSICHGCVWSQRLWQQSVLSGAVIAVADGVAWSTVTHLGWRDCRGGRGSVVCTSGGVNAEADGE